MVDPLDAARRFLAENAKEQEDIDRRRARARSLGTELAKDIIAKHPDTRAVWGFGSAYETWRDFRMNSDIDLAVESGDVMAVIRLVEGTEFAVDVVDLAACPESLADFIRSQGTILAEIRP